MQDYEAKHPTRYACGRTNAYNYILNQLEHYVKSKCFTICHNNTGKFSSNSNQCKKAVWME